MKKYLVGCSLISSTIYAGNVKDGMWLAGKKDVTDSAPLAVAQYLIQTDHHIEFDMNGNKYRLTVEKL